MLNVPPLTEIEARLASIDISKMTPFRLAILRNVSIEPIEPYLRFVASNAGLNAIIKFGDFENVMQEALADTSDLLTKDLDAVLLFTPLEALSPSISRHFAALKKDELKEEITRVGNYFDIAVQGIRQKTDATILWHGMEPQLYPSLGIRDAQLVDGQSSTINELNSQLRSALSLVKDAYLVDMLPCLARLGEKSFYDTRFWHMARAPYTLDALAMIAVEDFKFLRASKGLTKKCLVVDCDNTLWGGVVGEDGIDGVKLGTTYPGSAFLEFQQEVVSLYHRGVIIALCSKNNEQDVWEVFDRHPDMLLRREHIAAWRINWNDKATNIRELAEELNIGLDSLVFVEDSKFEAELVKDHIPEVEVVLLPDSLPTEYRRRLAASGLFDAPVLTKEDRQRGAMYRAEIDRRKIRSNTISLDVYLKSLEMELNIGFGDMFTAPRIAQQTQKTNQFNLTTRRYTEADISGCIDSKDCDVFWLSLKDKFGDLGIIGSGIVRYAGKCAEIDTFLLSCRALGRGAEAKFLSEIMHLVRGRGAESVIGEFIRTAKNAQVESFYLNNGFLELDHQSDADRRFFSFDLKMLSQRTLGNFSQVKSPIGEMSAKPLSANSAA